ncbi:MAG TPA: ABC transporter permease [Blastocatellia bacterium]|nr:ABC transporter permease [Blastocatellia bacterium]
MESTWIDIKYGARVLLKNRAFTTVSLITLALGIGATAGIFSVVNAVLLRPLPYQDSDRILRLSIYRSGKLGQVSPANFLDWRQQNQTFQNMAAFRVGDANVVSKAEPERVQLAVTSASFFDVLGVRPSLGRGFLPEDEAQGHRPVAIVSHRLYERLFGPTHEAAAGAAGEAAGEPPRERGTEPSVTIGGKLYTVIGAMPAAFDYPRGIQVWLPPDRIVPELDQNLGDVTQVRGLGYLAVIARLKDGVGLNQAQSDMDAINARLVEQYPDANAGVRIGAAPLKESITGSVRPALLLLIGAVGLLLLIACANVANLFLGRASARQKEIAVRRALGASPGRIVRQLLTESLMLSFIGGGLGLALGKWGIRALVALGGESIPRAGEIQLDARAIAVTMAISCAAGILFGLAPAVPIHRAGSRGSLQEGSRAGVLGNGLRSCLVVAEIALSLALLVGAGLLFRSFMNLEQVNPGFRADHLLTFQISPAGAGYEDAMKLTAFYTALLERLGAIPSVQAAGAVNTLPLDKGPFYGYFAENNPPYTRETQRAANFRAVSPDYFKAMGIPLLAGRTFSETDNSDSTGVLIINRTLARRDFPDVDPIGQRIGFGSTNGKIDWRQIVGVVDDFKNDGLNVAPLPEAYRPYLQVPFPTMSFVIHTSGDLPSVIEGVRAATNDLDRNQPISNIKAMDQILSENVSEPRFNMALVACFALVAMVMAASGIFAVMSYAVTARTHEIGVRMALGARRAHVLKLVVGKAAVLALAGIAIGVAGTLALSRLMSTLLFGVAPTDPVTFSAIAVTLALVALIASYIPARRAMGVDPMVALHQD